MKIAILRDHLINNSVDLMDNLVEAEFVERHLSVKHQVKQIEFVSDLEKVISEIKEYKPDVIFNLVETVCGSGALSIVAVQLIESLGIPYTGCTIFSQVVTADKSLTKSILKEKNLPTPDSDFTPNTEYILKAKTEHASAGLDDKCVRSFSSVEALQKSLNQKIKQTGLDWFAEKYINGREFSCAFLGSEILPPAEFLFDNRYKGHKIITYEAKWYEESDSYKLHQRSFDIEENLKNKIKELTDRCRKELYIKGYARVDYRMDNNENLYIIDINTNPCISPDSSFVAMIGQQNMRVEEMLDKIIDNAFVS